jgi:hypothetical protein
VGPGSIALAGDPSLANAILSGWDTSRLAGNRFQPLTNQDLATKYLSALSVDDLGDLPPNPQALLGCGDRFASGCGFNQAVELVTTGVLEDAAGGLDLMNADGSILSQESAVLKALTPGALVGHRWINGASYFEVGVTRPDLFTPEDAIQLEASGPPGTANSAAGGLTQAAYDFQIEPFIWDPDPDLLAKGVLLFDPNRPNALGENCTPLAGGPSPSCTDLEKLSSNLERIFINDGITGPDDALDPPESLQELGLMLDGDPSNDLWGDPLSGPDGIFFGNADTTGDGLRETKAVRVDVVPSLASDVNEDGEYTQDDVMLGGACTDTFCYRSVGSEMLAAGELPAGDDPNRYVDAKPVFVLVRNENDAQAVIPFWPGDDYIALHDLGALEQQDLLAADPNNPFRFDLDGDGADDPITINHVAAPGGQSVHDALLTNDLNSDSFSEIDEDKDGRFDWVDDFTPGPISDDNILCGSAIPRIGDPLQDALQFEFYDKSQAAGLASLFPAVGGLPPRTPSLCVLPVSLLSLTGESAPARRDFWWHRSDTDGDRVGDSVDNCPFVPNGPSWTPDPPFENQTDTDGNGIGDACQCGDVNNDGRINFLDARQILLDQVPPQGQRQCDVNGDGECNSIDARLILLGQVSSEHEDQLCPAYGGPAGT